MAKDQQNKPQKVIFENHYSRMTDSGYYNSQQIRTKINNYMTLTNQIYDNDSTLVQNIIIELQELLSMLQRQEQSFYKEFGITANEQTEFCDRINEWREGMGHLLDKETAQKVCDIMSEVIQDEDVLQAFNNYLNDPKDPLINTNILNTNIATFLNDNFFTDKDGKKKKGSFSTNVKEGVNASLQVTRNNQGKFVVSFKNGKNSEMSNYMKLKVIRTVNRGLEEENRVSTALTSEITKEIFNYLIDFPGVTPQMKLCLSNELYGRNKEYTKFPHLPVIQGWLGEVYWNAAFSYITNMKRASTPTGSMRNTKGQQLSVDMIYKNAGFQIKNWTFDSEGNKKIYKKMNFGNFLNDKVELLQTYVGQIIAQLFGAASYNKPTEETDFQDANYSDYLNTYQELIDLTQKFDVLTKIFYTQLNKIIEIDNGNELKEAFPGFDGKKIFYNTFWLLKDKVVPSSIIIEQLIEDIQSNFQTSNNKGISFSIISLTDKSLTNDKSPVWPFETNFTDKAMANRWSIEYEYIFNLNNLLNKVIYKI